MLLLHDQQGDILIMPHLNGTAEGRNSRSRKAWHSHTPMLKMAHENAMTPTPSLHVHSNSSEMLLALSSCNNLSNSKAPALCGEGVRAASLEPWYLYDCSHKHAVNVESGNTGRGGVGQAHAPDPPLLMGYVALV